MFFFKLIGKIIQNAFIKIIAAQMRITIGCFHFIDAFTKFQNGNIKCSATEIIDGDCMGIFLVQSIGKCCCGRLINNTHHFKSGNFPGLFCCLALGIIKICRNRNNGLCDWSHQDIFPHLL